MTRGIAPGVLCIVIKSTCGNEGREVVAVRPVRYDDHLPEIHRLAFSSCTGWLTKANEPLNFYDGAEPDDDARYGEFPASWLLPLHPGDDAQYTITDTPADAVAA